MFTEWNFLLAEIWVLLALAALIGLIAGWLIFGGRGGGTIDTGADASEVRRLRAELDRAKSANRAMVSDPLDDIPAMQGGGYTRPTESVVKSAALPTAQSSAAIETPTPVSQTPLTSPIPPADPPAPKPAPPAGDQTSATGAKPQGITAPRDGLPDDLTKIKGIGPKMEKMCNSLGYWHFDQIAQWTADEIAWVDDNLEGFKGRVTRDNWVAQAKSMTGTSVPAFVRRKD